ncbi:MAG: hypothetical protein RLZ12_1027 [Bacillota bacterium]|jgi:L-threonylcarbamoyladenylate synthase
MELLKTKNYKNCQELVQRAAASLEAGKLVAFPTETVYGLGVDANNEQAVARLFQVKKRPLDKPLTLHLADQNQLYNWWPNLMQIARRLVERFMPGPITLVLPRPERTLSYWTNFNLSRVGVRVPKCALAQAIFRVAKVPIVATSANLSDAASPTTAQQVLVDLGEKIDLVIDGGKVPVGIVSTVLDVTPQAVAVLRSGAIKAAEIQKVLP